MRIVGLPKSFYFPSHNQPIEISSAARQRLQWLRAWQRLRTVGVSVQKATE